MDPTTIFCALYAFYCLSTLWDAYLAFRQFALYRRTTARPSSVAEIISESDFDKARAYQLDNMQFAFVNDAFTFATYSIIILCTLYPWIWSSCGQMASWAWPGGAEIWHSIVFIWVSSVVETLISLPFSYYHTFFIEQKHGFNNETVPFFFKDRAMKLGVSLALSSPVVALLVWIIRNGGPNFPIYAWLALSLIIFLMMFVYPEFIAPLFDKYSPLPDSELKRKIEALADRVGFPLAKLYVVENSKRSSHSNAYMYGFWNNKRIVLFDTLMSKEMNELLKKTEEQQKNATAKKENESGEEKSVEHDDDASSQSLQPSAAAEKEEETNLTTTKTSSDHDNEQQQQQDEDVQQPQQQQNMEEEGDGQKSDGGKAEEVQQQTKRQIGMDDDEVVAVLGHELGHWKLGHTMLLLTCTEVNLLLMLVIFSLFHQQESLFTAFGFPPAQQQPILIGLLIIGRFVMAPYTELLSVLMNVITRKCEFSADRFSAQLGHASQLCSGLKKMCKDNLSLPIDDVLYSWCNHSHPPIPERIEALKKYE
ncbi:hypothetical protein niasHS_013997 [Heterodera schachtii]|uniref:Ste24 endopeptidase n=1 Tax=Heterodera schachtii TaxID=97005 RepID=A0ABD2IPF2_HETSC